MTSTTPSQESSLAHADHARPVVNSFDVFDTLIARRCCEPVQIHAIVETKTGFTGFSQIRCDAETAVSGGDYSLDNIYDNMGLTHGIDFAVLAYLKQIEIEVELDNVIPIADVMSLVRDGDILVSDMYLDEATIRRLLRKAEFDKHVGLYVSPHGKISGKVWPKLLKTFRVATHWGNNKQSDVESPQAQGIHARHVALSLPLQAEAWLISIGLRDLALLCREVRLKTPSVDPIFRQLQDMQATLNFPMLLLASVKLAHLIEQQGLKRVLFSSRDGEMWMNLFRNFASLIGLNCEISYFYTSRLARRFPSANYLDYARDSLSGQTLLLDLCGTGWSIAHLAKSVGLDKCPTFLLAQAKVFESYEKSAPMPDTCDFHSIIGPKSSPLGNGNLELLNQAPYGSIVDVKWIDSAIVPVLNADHRPPSVIEFVRCQNKIFAALVDAMDRYGVRNLITLDDETASNVVEALARHICAQPLLSTLFATSAIEEDIAVCNRLGCPEIYNASLL